MKKIIYSIAALLLCAPLLASAAEGWIVADISLQAGPDPEYPSIMELSADTPVTIEGCIDGWAWCDVIADGERGWVPGTYLQEEYSGQRVYVIDYGSRIGIPVVSFSLGLYWNSHYHNRPFYSQRQQWESRAIRPHSPPRPAGVAASRPAEQRSSTPTQERSAPTTQEERRSPTPTAAPASAPRATTEREAPRTQRPTEQRPAMPAKPEESRPAKSDAAAQMRPAKTPEAEPRQQQRPTPKAQESKKAEQPKAKEEPKKPEKDKDNGGGK